MKKIVQSIEHQFVDAETGELKSIETSKVFKTAVTEDSFYMVFTKFIAPFYELNSVKAQQLLIWMCENAEFNTGIVKITPADRKRIEKEFNFGKNMIANSLRLLKQKGLVTGELGEFKINPQIFWKGDLKIRHQILEKGEFNIQINIGQE